MKLQRSLLALLLLVPVGAFPQEGGRASIDPAAQGRRRAEDLSPGLRVGARVVRLAPPELQDLLDPGASVYRLDAFEGRWMRLVPERLERGMLRHAVWVDASRLTGYVLVDEPTARPDPSQYAPDPEAAALLEECKANLRSIHAGLGDYHQKYKLLPARSGTAFFAALITDKVWENDAQNPWILTCPAVSPDALPGLRGREPEEWYADPNRIDESCSAYWGRDVKNHPLRRFPLGGDEALAACNHHQDGGGQRITLVLLGDGTVREIADRELRALGRLRANESLQPGPRSQDAALRRLAPK